MNRIKELLNLLPHHLQVEFAIYCVNDVKELLPKEGLLALELTQKWLKNPLSVSNKELIDAAAASAASAAAYAAASSAPAAHAAYSAAHAAPAANAASSAASAAAHAAHAAYSAAHAAHA